MWPFIRKRQVLDRLESVESAIRRVQVEWEETLERVQKQVWRAQKTAARTPLLNPDDTSPVPTSEPAPTSARPPAKVIGMDPVSARIRAARGRRTTVLGGGE